MATLTIRNLPDAVRDKLRLRAAAHGRSMEAEARALLEAGVAGLASGVGENAEAYARGDATEGLPSWVGFLKGELAFHGTAEDWAALDKEIERDFLGEDDDDAP